MSTPSQLTREQEASFKRIVGRAVLVPIAVMLVASVLLAWLVSHLLSVTNWVDHTDKVIAKARNSERLIMDMQTALRGNLLTGSPQLLDSFNRIAPQIPPALDDLTKEVSDNAPQVGHEKTLRADYEQWEAYARELLARHEHKQDYASMKANTEEMALMNRIHGDFDRFVSVENDLRTQRNLDVETIARVIRGSRLLVLAALGLGIGLYVRQQLRATARLYEQALTVAEQKSEALRVSEASLREAQAKLRTHAEDLEKTVTERTAQLRETVGELESYSYSVSHDLRGPLRAVRGYAGVLLDDFGSNFTEQPKAYLRRIMTACDRMDALIRDVLTYSQLNRMEIKSEPVDLENLVREIIQQYPGLADEDKTIQVERPLPRLLVPQALLSQCISNLLTNAMKFQREGVKPEVRVRAETHANDVRIWVEDNGIGIAPQYHDRIFGVFERIPGETAYEGTGIGLAIVRKAAERMGGKVGVVSETGKGSRFWVDLPGRKI